MGGTEENWLDVQKLKRLKWVGEKRLEFPLMYIFGWLHSFLMLTSFGWLNSFFLLSGLLMWMREMLISTFINKAWQQGVVRPVNKISTNRKMRGGHMVRFHGLVVRTLDSESSNPSSNLGGTFIFLITTTTTIFVILPPHSATNPWWCGPLSTIIRFPPSKLRPLSSSSSSTSVSVVEEGEVGEAPFF